MPLHVDLALAGRIEETESVISADFALGMGGVPSFVQPIAGGRAVFAGVGGPMTEAKAMGMNGPVTDADLETLERVFFSRGSAAKVWICPLADPSLAEGLTRRGYGPVEFETILFRTLADLSDLPDPPGEIAITPAAPVEKGLYAEVIGTAFLYPEPLTPELRALFTAGFWMPGSTPFLARIGGRVVGGGTLMIREGLAFLAGAATMPEFRNRGVQTALSWARLNHARLAGCDLAVQGARPGSVSQRTAERLGFRVAYTKVAVKRDAPAT
jgi:hypothetical protein